METKKWELLTQNLLDNLEIARGLTYDDGAGKIKEHAFELIKDHSVLNEVALRGVKEAVEAITRLEACHGMDYVQRTARTRYTEGISLVEWACIWLQEPLDNPKT